MVLLAGNMTSPLKGFRAIESRLWRGWWEGRRWRFGGNHADFITGLFVDVWCSATLLKPAPHHTHTHRHKQSLPLYHTPISPPPPQPPSHHHNIRSVVSFLLRWDFTSLLFLANIKAFERTLRNVTGKNYILLFGVQHGHLYIYLVSKFFLRSKYTTSGNK